MSVYNGPIPSAKQEFVTANDNGKWEFNGKMGVGLGFVYMVYDTDLHRFYIGRKNYLARSKGRLVTSDWKTYKSSSKILESLMAHRPPDAFKWICLDQYYTASGLAYAETWSLVYVDAPLRKHVYNKRIEAISWNVKEPVSQIHIDTLTKYNDMAVKFNSKEGNG